MSKSGRMRTRVRTSVMTLVSSALLAGVALVAISLTQSPASAVPNTDFTITSTISSSPTSQSAALLYPGVQRYIWYTVTNSLTVPITVTSLSISAVTVTVGVRHLQPQLRKHHFRRDSLGSGIGYQLGV